ncbi:potassium channel family protein [Lentzea albidocapillata]|uniref:potassium channel family protein n=1 Tax=Lentzea albidocapillata TaxID=40571 RepID=UPI001FECBEED|nr:TrkA family potassium uptake protein [Lentzea albidocapillata]
MASPGKEQVVVIGLGRFGSALAVELASHGTDVLAIDSRPNVVQRLSGRLSHVVTADSTDVEALRQLGVADYDRAVVGIGTDMEASILTIANLVDLGIERIWAKAVTDQHASILKRVGASFVVLPEHEMGERVAHLVAGRMLDYIEIDSDFAMIKTEPPRDLVGVPLGETKLPDQYNVSVTAVRSNVDGENAVFKPATPNTVLMYGDVILVIGRIADVERFADSL